jgi:hypothetical protein
MRGEAVAVQEDWKQGLAVRTALPGRLSSLLMDGRDPILLLGAGASITSGIPAAGTTVEKVARWAWCKENGRHPDDFTIRRSDYGLGSAACPGSVRTLPSLTSIPKPLKTCSASKVIAGIFSRSSSIRMFRHPGAMSRLPRFCTKDGFRRFLRLISISALIVPPFFTTGLIVW